MVRCIIWCAVSSRAQNEPDKISLPQQESDSIALAEGNGWEIVDVLRVPGHSRRYVDFHKLASDAAKQGVDAFNRLYRHWETKDFAACSFSLSLPLRMVLVRLKPAREDTNHDIN